MISQNTDNKQTILDKMRDSDVFMNISDEHLRRILENSSEDHYPDGAVIVNQGSTNRSFFLILDGCVEIYRHDKVSGQDFSITKLKEGDEFGELSLILEEERSANVRADGDVRVLQLSVAELDHLRKSEPDSAYGAFMHNLAREIGKKLVLTDDLTVKHLRSELTLVREQAAMAQFLLVVSVIMTLFSFATAIVNQFSDNLTIADTFSNTAVLLSFVAMILLIWRSPYTLNMFGLRLPTNWTKHIIITISWTMIVMIVATGIKWIVIQTIPVFSDVPLFFLPGGDYPAFDGIVSRFGIGLTLAYIIVAPIQEFMTRGVLQESLTRFFHHWQAKHFLAILVSNGMFSATHLYLSPAFGVMTFIIGCIWGFQYIQDKDRSILGVSFSHAIIGLYVLRILGLTTMLQMIGL